MAHVAYPDGIRKFTYMAHMVHSVSWSVVCKHHDQNGLSLRCKTGSWPTTFGRGQWVRLRLGKGLRATATCKELKCVYEEEELQTIRDTIEFSMWWWRKLVFIKQFSTFMSHRCMVELTKIQPSHLLRLSPTVHAMWKHSLRCYIIFCARQLFYVDNT